MRAPRNTVWNEDKLQYLLSNYKVLTCSELADSLQINISNIKSKLRKLNLKKPNRSHKFEDSIKKIINKQIYNWLILSRDKKQKSKIHAKCLLCNKIKSINFYSLMKGESKSCGCSVIINVEPLKKWIKINGSPHKKPKGVAAFNKLISNYKYRALKKNYSFDLTDQEFKNLTQQNCFYCNRIPNSISQNIDINGNYIYNGIDRKNNETGYPQSNCITCCNICNYFKGSYNYYEFLSLIINIYENLEKNGWVNDMKEKKKLSIVYKTRIKFYGKKTNI